MLNKTISNDAHKLLKSLIGEDFLFVGGVNLPDYLVSDNLIVETSGAALSIYGDLEEQALGPDSDDDFSFFVVEAATIAETDSVHKSGNMYLLDKRSRINGISVIRDQISFTAGGVKRWELVWDSSIVLHLEMGAISISFLSLSAEGLRVDFFEEFSIAALPVPSSGYEDSLLSQYNTDRSVISILASGL